MKDNDKINNIFRNFPEFVAIAAERELESFIIDATYTSAFNYRMKKLLEEVKKEKIFTKRDFLKDFKKFDPDTDSGKEKSEPKDEEKKEVIVTLTSKVDE